MVLILIHCGGCQEGYWGTAFVVKRIGTTKTIDTVGSFTAWFLNFVMFRAFEREIEIERYCQRKNSLVSISEEEGL